MDVPGSNPQCCSMCTIASEIYMDDGNLDSDLHACAERILPYHCTYDFQCYNIPDTEKRISDQV